MARAPTRSKSGATDLRPDWADRIARKLDALRAIDAQRSTFGSDTHGFVRGELADDAALAQLEKIAGGPLPDDYRHFLQHVGSRVGPDYGLAPIEEQKCDHEGAVFLTDMGCGYFSFLGVTGERRGQVWLDYTAGDGEIVKAADSFLAWYERWLDDSLRSAIAGIARASIESGARSPHHALLAEHRGLFDAVEIRSFAAADRAIVAAYFGEEESARRMMLESIAALGEHGYVQGAAGVVFRRDLEDAASAKGDALAALAKHPYAAVRRSALGNPAIDEASVMAIADRSREALLVRPDDPDAFVELDLVARANGSPPAMLETLASARDGLGSWVARGVACNPAISSALLETLAKHPAPWVRHAVAHHPRATKEQLERLGEDEHPIVRAAAASNPATSPALLTKLALDDHPRVIDSVAGNASTPIAVLVMLLVGPRLEGFYYLAKNHARLPPDARACLELHPNFYPSYLEPDRGPSIPPPTAPAFDVLRSTRNTFHPSYPVPLFRQILESEDDLVTYGMATHPFVDAEILERIATHRYGYTRLNVVNRRDISPVLLLRMIDDKWPDVTAAAVQHPHFPVERLADLAKHESDRVRENVASHPKLDRATLERLASDPEAYVRRGAGMNPSIPIELLEKLSNDTSEFATWAVAWNERTPIAILERLAKAKDERTRKTAVWRLAAEKLRLTMVNT